MLLIHNKKLEIPMIKSIRVKLATILITFAVFGIYISTSNAGESISCEKYGCKDCSCVAKEVRKKLEKAAPELAGVLKKYDIPPSSVFIQSNHFGSLNKSPGADGAVIKDNIAGGAVVQNVNNDTPGQCGCPASQACYPGDCRVILHKGT
jgi:hypothetical protein